MLLMVDRSYPPTDAELAVLRQNGVAVVCAYIGGVTDGGRAWHPNDVARCLAAGFKVMGIYVGQNIVPNFTPTLTRAQGTPDGNDAVACARAYGLTSGPLCTDDEYNTYTSNVAGDLAYTEAWSFAVGAAGYLPVVYAPPQAAVDYRPQPGHPTGLWIANWDQVGDLNRIPNAASFTGVGWQYYDLWQPAGTDGAFDISHVDGKWWDVSAPATTEITFPQTGHKIIGGFYQFWANRGGLPIFGMPLTDEEQVTGADGKPLTVQYFERARFEWHPETKGDPAADNNWNVELGRVGDELMKAQAALASATQSTTDWSGINEALDALDVAVKKAQGG